MPKTCYIIVGPTAVGKTAFGIALAQHLQTEIISADSRQCFLEMSIGVAKPSTSELNAVPHHFINSHSIQQLVNVVDFENYALEKIETIFEKSDDAVMVGGTGLYVKAFCEGIDEIPAVDEAIRLQIRNAYDQKGMDWLQTELQTKDPQFAATGEMKNPQRMLRALEVMLTTGRSIMQFQTSRKVKRSFNIKKIGLDMPRNLLVERIDKRVDQMLADGLVAEAKGLLPYKHLNALQTVGYKELFEFFEGQISFEKAVEDIKIHTRQFAKRQMTWFKKDVEIEWLDATNTAQLQAFIQNA
jgi:tRNA dimethylallyltransferase